MFEKQIDLLNDNFNTVNELKKLLSTIEDTVIKDNGGYKVIIKDSRNAEEYEFTYNYNKSAANTISDYPLLFNSQHITLRVGVWTKNNKCPLVPEDILHVFRAFWHVDSCDNNTCLPQIHSSDNEEKLRTKIENWNSEKKCYLCFRIKGKNYYESFNTFKKMVISNIIFSVLQNGNSIVIETAENMIGVLLQYSDKSEILQFAYDVYQSVNVDDNNNIDIAAIDINNICSSYDILDKSVNEVFKDIDNDTENNTKSIVRVSRIKEIDLDKGTNEYKLGIIRTIYNINNKNFFRNIYLDFISDYVSRISENEIYEISKLKNQISNVINWLNLKDFVNNNCKCNSCNKEKKWDTDIWVSKYDIELAILQGILRNRNTENKSIEVAWGNELIIKIDNEFVYNDTVKGEKLDINWSIQKKVNNRIDDYNRDAILITTSDSSCLPKDIFYKEIIVDTNPTIGGGLPDFWAQHLSSLITSMESNENLSRIIIWGDFSNAKNIKDILYSVSSWDKASISKYGRKIFRPESKIERFKEKFSDKIIIYNKKEDLIEDMFQWSMINKKNIDQNKHRDDLKRILKRKTDLSKWKLTNKDGLRTETLSQAYPMVLDILRNGDKEKNKCNQLVDANGRALYELMNYKIVLSKPNEDMVPVYFLDEERDLNVYYEEVYNENGIFGKPIRESGQYEKVTSYIAGVVKDHNYSSRKSIIIIPNGFNELSAVRTSYSNPIGLIAIWIAPRKRDGNINLDISFMWRTVEALIGLPYSLYGSIRFANKIVTDVYNTIRENDPTGKIKQSFIQLGNITYTACSLHMYLDEETKRIAKGIVNDVSY